MTGINGNADGSLVVASSCLSFFVTLSDVLVSTNCGHDLGGVELAVSVLQLDLHFERKYNFM